jgi:hypothetical protein
MDGQQPSTTSAATSKIGFDANAILDCGSNSLLTAQALVATAPAEGPMGNRAIPASSRKPPTGPAGTRGTPKVHCRRNSSSSFDSKTIVKILKMRWIE